MTTIKVGKTFTFDAAHLLPNHPGKCRNLHGHTYRVEVEVQGTIREFSGMVMDFNDLDAAVKPILAVLDHSFLNIMIDTPTAENIAIWILEQIRDLPVSRVRVWESPDTYAEATAPVFYPDRKVTDPKVMGDTLTEVKKTGWGQGDRHLRSRGS